MIYDANNIFTLQCINSKFLHRVSEVINLMYGDKIGIIYHDDSIVNSDLETIVHYYHTDNNESHTLTIPFNWINMSYEELKKIKENNNVR